MSEDVMSINPTVLGFAKRIVSLYHSEDTGEWSWGAFEFMTEPTTAKALVEQGYGDAVQEVALIMGLCIQEVCEKREHAAYERGKAEGREAGKQEERGRIAEGLKPLIVEAEANDKECPYGDCDLGGTQTLQNVIKIVNQE